ncbi:protein of unknown function DUF4283 - like 10 [Theobroma cacao]|nr:protein of unknown function DUF4283 - like 10 [Theobroma cacao]
MCSLQKTPKPTLLDDRSWKKVRFRNSSGDGFTQDDSVIVHNNPSFKATVLGSDGEEMLSGGDDDPFKGAKDESEFEMECDSAESDEEDFEYSLIKGFPSITVSDKRQELLARRWQNSVIVQMLDRVISYRILCDRVASLWRPKGKYDIVDLADNRFIVRFVDKEDFLRALLDGPWVIMGHYLTVHPWTPNFSPEMQDLTAITAWVRFPGGEQSTLIKVQKLCLEIGIRSTSTPRTVQGGSGSRFSMLDMVESGTANAVNSDVQQPALSYKVQSSPLTKTYERKVKRSQKSLQIAVSNGSSSSGTAPLTPLTGIASALQVSKEGSLSQHDSNNLQVEACVPTITTLDNIKHSAVIPKEKVRNSSVKTHAMDNQSTKLAIAESSGGVILSKEEGKQSGKSGNICLQQSSLKKKAKTKHNGTQNFFPSFSLLKEEIIQPSMSLSEGKGGGSHAVTATNECPMNMVDGGNMEVA